MRYRLTGWLPSAAPGAVGIVGYSFGARSALVYTMRYGGVAVLVSFDGGIANEAGKNFLDKAPYFQPDRITTPAGMRPRTGFETIADLTRVALVTDMLADPLNRAVASESSRRRVASAEILPARRSPR